MRRLGMGRCIANLGVGHEVAFRWNGFRVLLVPAVQRLHRARRKRIVVLRRASSRFVQPEAGAETALFI
jgi:hypothetical protein